MSAMLAVLGRGLVDPAEPVVRVDDAGLNRGDGCFEGCHLPAGAQALDKLDAHLARMARSAAALDIPFAPAAWRALIDEAVGAWAATHGGEAAVKLLLTRGPVAGEAVGLVWITEVAASTLALRRRGLRVITLDRGVASDAFATSPWLLGGVKSLSYAINVAAQREAARRDADDVIFVSTDGVVLEAPTASVVWCAGGRTLHTTPPGDTGILAGTTQQLLFEQAAAAGWRTSYTRATVADLHAADALWLVGSVRGAVDVVELDGKPRERNPTLDAEVRRLCGF